MTPIKKQPLAKAKKSAGIANKHAAAAKKHATLSVKHAKLANKAANHAKKNATKATKAVKAVKAPVTKKRKIKNSERSAMHWLKHGGMVSHVGGKGLFSSKGVVPYYSP